MNEKGNVGAGWCIEGARVREGYMRELGPAATVWGGEVSGVHGEVSGVHGELMEVPADRKVLILSDSQAAIAAARKAGRARRARTAELKGVVENIWDRQARLGSDAVRFSWVKVHVGGTRGNEFADQLVKEGAALSEEWSGPGCAGRWQRGF